MATDDPTPASLGQRAEAFVGTAASAARWAVRAYVGLARRLPGAAAVEAEWRRLERAALVELRRRLDAVDPLGDRTPVPVEEPAVAVPGTAPPAVTTPARQTEPLRGAMAELLLRSMEQNAQRAREYLYLTTVRQLVPDEARILAALADGTVYPVVHVERRTGVAGGERLLSNASTVGRAAGVAELREVPRYLARLRRLELVELGEADPELAVPYEILLTDPDVRAAERAARDGGRVRFVRGTLRLSPLGRRLWDACSPREDVDAPWAPADPAVDTPAVTAAPEPPDEPRTGSVNGSG